MIGYDKIKDKKTHISHACVNGKVVSGPEKIVSKKEQEWNRN